MNLSPPPILPDQQTSWIIPFLPSWLSILFGGGLLTWVWKGASRVTSIENKQGEQEKALLALRAELDVTKAGHNTLALAVERLPTRDEMISAMRDLRTDLRDDLREMGRPRAGADRSSF